jgi:hypothetical protein
LVIILENVNLVTEFRHAINIFLKALPRLS